MLLSSTDANYAIPTCFDVKKQVLPEFFEMKISEKITI